MDGDGEDKVWYRMDDNSISLDTNHLVYLLQWEYCIKVTDYGKLWEQILISVTMLSFTVETNQNSSSNPRVLL